MREEGKALIAKGACLILGSLRNDDGDAVDNFG